MGVSENGNTLVGGPFTGIRFNLQEYPYSEKEP